MIGRVYTTKQLLTLRCWVRGTEEFVQPLVLQTNRATVTLVLHNLTIAIVCYDRLTLADIALGALIH